MDLLVVMTSVGNVGIQEFWPGDDTNLGHSGLLCRLQAGGWLHCQEAGAKCLF